MHRGFEEPWLSISLLFVPPLLSPPPNTLQPQSPHPPSSGQKTECDVSSPSPHKAPVHWTHLGQHKGWKARRGLDTQDHAAKPDKDASKVEQQTVAFFSSALFFFFPGPYSEREREREKKDTEREADWVKRYFCLLCFCRHETYECDFWGNVVSMAEQTL